MAQLIIRLLRKLFRIRSPSLEAVKGWQRMIPSRPPDEPEEPFPSYLLDAVKNALLYMQQGHLAQAQEVLEYVVREVESGSYRFIGTQATDPVDDVLIDDRSGFDAG